MFFPSILLAALCVLCPLATARAAYVTWGNIDPANPSAWSTSTTGYVGETSDGSLTVNGGSGLLSGSAYIGYNSAVGGTMTVAGPSSKWTNGGNSRSATWATGCWP